jgi:hypothetical protein
MIQWNSSIRIVTLVLFLLILITSMEECKGENSRMLGKAGYTRCTKGSSVVYCQNKSSVCDISSDVARCFCIVGFVGASCDIRSDKCPKINPCQNISGSYCVDNSDTSSSKRYECYCFQGYKAIVSNVSKNKTLGKCVKKIK